MGHVPAGPVSEEGEGADLPRRERRGGRAARVRAAQARRHLGGLGERTAAAFLKRRGALILARNLSSGRGEIDLVAEIEGIVVAVEVKTRIGAEPSTQLTEAKLRRMRAAAARLRPRPHRVDFVGVRLGSAGATIRWWRGVG